jgi:excisionase family DNA binding protein
MTPLLTAQDVADRLGVSKDWVWAQARAGTIPHVRLGRHRRFRAEAIEAWIVELEASNTVSRLTAPHAVQCRHAGDQVAWAPAGHGRRIDEIVLLTVLFRHGSG